MSSYVFDQAWTKERQRLQAIESLYDGSTTRRLTELGVCEGWRCLEVGCGAGGVALWLADQVGRTGRVVATDLDTRFVDGHVKGNLDVRTHNIVTDELPDAEFDVAHARAVLEHIPQREQALTRMVAAVKPGGWLLVEDIDFGGPMSTSLSQYFPSPALAAASERVQHAIAAVLAGAGSDPTFGKRLPATLRAAGLVNIGAELHTPIVSGGSEKFIPASVEHLTQPMIDTGKASAADIEAALAAFADASAFYAVLPMVTAWGQRPAL
jgi:2-polyprenyl-3-methyl-5-hydroxy-6-metoxy-1,4-benzoquinol methylase